MGGIDKRFIEGQNLYVYLQSANFISFWPTLIHSLSSYSALYCESNPFSSNLLRSVPEPCSGVFGACPASALDLDCLEHVVRCPVFMCKISEQHYQSYANTTFESIFLSCAAFFGLFNIFQNHIY